MLVLGIDTAFYYLNLTLIKDDLVIASHHEKCFRNQAELLVPNIEKLLKKVDLTCQEIDAMVISKGPGSYTGIRIAMSFAKVFCSVKNIPLYTLSTLLLYSGLKPTLTLIDARASRCFFSIYNQGRVIVEDCIIENSEALKMRTKHLEYHIYGDGHLIGEPDDFPCISENFLLLKDYWQIIENIHLLKPEYLKEEDAYG